MGIWPNHARQSQWFEVTAGTGAGMRVVGLRTVAVYSLGTKPAH